MAVRRGRRESFFSPAKVSFERRGRVVVLTPGINDCTSGSMVEEPMSSVSSRPRW